MDRDILAGRYGDAFLAFTKEGCGIEKGAEDLRSVNRILVDNPDLDSFLLTPGIDNREKFEVLENVIRNGFSDEVKYFLKLLINKGRFDKFGDIADYVRTAYSHGIEVDALLKVSYPLDTEVIKRVKEAIENRLNKKLHLYIDLDPDILGGIYARIGNILIDGSIKRRLEDMRAKLLAVKVVYA
ncbi:MAG: ATP synthase F1 subunit delta [Candidatus Omnitrophota bacterium]|nr:ATP synthase F1 subunit delta [Candidatus Omnitrophota bacterium]